MQLFLEGLLGRDQRQRIELLVPRDRGAVPGQVLEVLLGGVDWSGSSSCFREQRGHDSPSIGCPQVGHITMSTISRAGLSSISLEIAACNSWDDISRM